jgi:hypothetical protein
MRNIEERERERGRERGGDMERGRERERERERENILSFSSFSVYTSGSVRVHVGGR